MNAPQPTLSHFDSTISGTTHGSAQSSPWLLGEPGLAGRVALSWGLAGGLSMEAILVAAALLSGTPAATSDPLVATLFFLFGVVGGFVHGALVGVVGRPDDVTLSRAVQSVKRSAVVAAPLAVLTWGAGIWISLTSAEVVTSHPDLLVAMGAGWLILTAAAVWACREGCCALRHALTRWPLGRVGWVLIPLVSASLLVTFVWWRPEIWFTDVRTTALGAALLSVGVTFWFAMPVVVLGLQFLHRRNGRRAGLVGEEQGGRIRGE